MLQIRYDDGSAYDPNRDIVNLFPLVAQNAAIWLSGVGWPPELRGVAKANELGPEHLIPAITALNNLTALATTYSTPEETYRAAGFEYLATPVRVAALMALSLSLITAFDMLSKHANPNGHVVNNQDESLDISDRAKDALTKSDKERAKRAKQIPMGTIEETVLN